MGGRKRFVLMRGFFGLESLVGVKISYNVRLWVVIMGRSCNKKFRVLVLVFKRFFIVVSFVFKGL